MEKNSWLKYIAAFIAIIILSFLIEVFIFNFNILTLNSKYKGSITITDYTITEDEDNKILTIALDEIYVNKLRVVYSVTNDVSVNVSYIEKDYYGNEKTSSFSDNLSSKLSEEITNYKNYVTEITYSYDKDADLEISEITVDNNLRLNFFRIIFVSITLLIFYLLFMFFKNGTKTKYLHFYFFTFGLLVGITFIILQPSTTYYSWDDQIHFTKVLQLFETSYDWNIGEFNMIDGNQVGRGGIDSLEEQLIQMEYLNDDSYANYSTTTKRFIDYNKIAFIPAAIGYKLSSFLGLSFSICFKIGKVFNLLAYLLIFSCAIKISKTNKRLLAVIGLLPTSIFLACQYSYDPAVISGITLAIVILMNWFTDKKSKVDFKSMFIFLFAILYGSFPKAIYIPIILLFIFIPNSKFSNKKQALFLKSLIVVLLVLVLSTFVSPSTLSVSAGGDSRGGNTNSGEQLNLIFTHPIGYISILKNTALASFFNKLVSKSLVGSYAYIGNISDNCFYIYLILLIFVSVTDAGENKTLKLLHKIVFAVILIGIAVLIWTALYLSYTPVGEMSINGVQARYFIPLLFPFILCLQSCKIKNNITEKIYNTLVLAIPTIIIMISIYQLVLVNYCM